ncbi:FAD binding domain-containing protein [Microbacterium sp. W1N]|uniref:FAD binding domain-containing protein n=1 Tax=Microbacterium festucae TaxID=2977531 RepID=UPI0021C0DC53|nr:FAD binding domain-containing protein [Microbacterium festucae]MCT9819359.1 FAD binding domain-containing protein [Microbacterium festucae]
MDITSVQRYRRATTRTELALAPGETILAGGTWLMSEPQPGTTGFVDITAMGWPDLEPRPEGLRIAATCTIATLVRWAESAPDAGSPAPPPSAWPAVALIPAAASALLASFKIWNTATVGGNVCRSFAAGALVSLCVALDGEAEIWMPDGGARRLPVAALITGNGTNALAPGEVLRALWLPASALRSRARLHKIALAEHGRSGAVVTGRVDPDGQSVFTVTAATLTPTVLRFSALPDAVALAHAVGTASGYYSDPLGAADWRRAVSVELATRIRTELAA